MKRFLDRVPDNARMRSHGNNLFLGAAVAVLADLGGDTRGGLPEERVCRHVWRRLNERKGPHEDPPDWSARLQQAMRAHRAEALDLARWALHWKSLPPQERERRSRERGAQYARAWREKGGKP